MPKKHTIKAQARYHTNTQQRRAQIPSGTPDAQVKDVTTQLRELRIEQAKERPLRQTTPTMTTPEPFPVAISPLGFTPANYIAVPYDDDPLADRPSSSRTTRRIPGPPPPRSWLQPQRKSRLQQPYRLRSRNYPDAPFPDIEMPDRKTLLHSSLLMLGTQFFEHQEYNKYNLPQLGIQLKQWLLTYIATRNIAGAITKEGLDVLFPTTTKDDDPEEMKQIIVLSKEDEKHLRCLDLTDALAGNISIAQLRTFLLPTLLPEGWQEPRFPNLTYLSLETSALHPIKVDSLKLVNILSRECTRLTHLNLAGIFPPGSGSSLYQLSKWLVCLEYIDLSRNVDVLNGYIDTWDINPQEEANWDNDGMEVNVPADRDDGTQIHSDPQVASGVNSSQKVGGNWTRVVDALNWEGGWRRVNILVAKKCGSRKGDERDIQEMIFAKRKERGWIQVVLT